MRDFHLPGRSAVFAENGLCATSHPLAAKTATSLLEQGGNAVDAAIGAAVLLGICEPQMTGIGGDCFALIHDPARNEMVGLNGSGRAPKALDPSDLRDQGWTTMKAGHPAAVTIPGAVDGFCRLHGDFGRLDMAEVLAPAIRYAEEGVPVSPRTSFDWHLGANNLIGRARDLYLINGAPADPGDRFSAPIQAEVLRRVASDGRKAFYEGEIAADMVASLRSLGGMHTLDDFAETSSTYITPLQTKYKDWQLFELPPNGQGAAAMLMTGILSHFDLPSLEPFGANRAHIEAESAKLAYDARNRFVADPNHVSRLDHLLDPRTAERLAALIDPNRALPTPTPLAEEVHKDTVYLTVVDRDRMAVSLIYSVFHKFGSGLASDKFGILFHNRGSGFNLIPGHPNEAGGGKRPMHTIIPGMIREPDGSLMPFGVMGGHYQANGHARFLTNLADYNLFPQAAIDAPRSFADAGELRLERGYGPDVSAALAEMGHKIVTPPEPIGGAQAIRIDATKGHLQGASDHRKDGCALGY